MLQHELYHWGVKGMKWGIRRIQRLSKHAAKERKKKRQMQSDIQNPNQIDFNIQKREDRVTKNNSASRFTERYAKKVSGYIVDLGEKSLTDYVSRNPEICQKAITSLEDILRRYS